MALVYTQENDSSVSITNANETVVATVANLTTQRSGQSVSIDFAGQINTGAGTTALVLKCKRGTTTGGTQVGNSVTLASAALSSVHVSAMWNDTPGDVAAQSYVVTVTQTSATGAGAAAQSATTTTVGNP